MKISPIKFTVPKLGFKGEFVDFNDEYSLRRQKQWHNNSTMVKTLGEYHEKPKYKAYFAAPLEDVSEEIMEKVDYVIYDNEPGYPKLEDIKENYLGKKRVNYGDAFEEQRQYFYRREIGGHANVEEAKYHQWQSASCLGLYNEAGDLRYKKEAAEDAIVDLGNEKDRINKEIENAKISISEQRSMTRKLDKQLSVLEALKTPYKSIKSLAEQNKDAQSDLYKTASERKYKHNSFSFIHQGAAKDISTNSCVAEAGRSLDNIEQTIKRLQTAKQECSIAIKRLTDDVKKLGNRAIATEARISDKEAFVNDCVNKLKPLFEKMAEFYKKNNIRVRG